MLKYNIKFAFRNFSKDKSYFSIQQWLENFAFRINLSPNIFIISGFLTLVIAWVTVSLQTVKAASANPANNLKE